MLKLIPLGGLGEIGLNIMAIEYDRNLLVIDAGIMFPDDYMPGVDLVIPDFQYLRQTKDRIKAIVLTHGHDDHIGAVPFLLREFSVPVFGSTFTLGLLRHKLEEHHLLEKTDLREIGPGDSTRIGPYSIEYISVNHSIVDGVGLAINTPEGIIIHSGDFRIDPTPVDGQVTDLIRFAHFGAMGVLALLSDSTNAEKEGFTLSERDVGKALQSIFQGCQGRIIVTVFASNISRIRQIIELAAESDRKIVFNGKSMITNTRIAREQGLISIPDDMEIREHQLGQFEDQNIAIITTGSQGEPMSALARMARGEHKSIKIKRGDTVVLSSRFIPGNEKAITSIINRFYRIGADVVYEKISDIHTSGHAKREELKLMLSLVNPRYFVPIHGEYRHLVNHARLALDMGMAKERVLVAEDGDVISFENNQATIGAPVPTGRIFVDGKGVGDVGEMVLRDRRRLSGHGMVFVLLAVDEQTGDTMYGPEIISRGFVFEDRGGTILEQAKVIVLEALDNLDVSSPVQRAELESDIERRLKRFFYDILGRRPLILPTVLPL